MAVDVATLQTLSLFKDLTADQLEKVARLCSQEHISPGQTFFREGEPGKTIFVVKKGEVEVLHTVGGDALASMEWIGAGDVLGIRALFPPYRYLSTARSLTDGTLLEIDVVKLRELFPQDSQLAISILENSTRTILNRIASLRARL
jgi:CRP-like cAMP-binding protein